MAATYIPRKRPFRSRHRPAPISRLAFEAAADREGVDPEFDRIEPAELVRAALPAAPDPCRGAE
jgi:hypothetical protein